MEIGAHISTAGGIDKSIPRASDIGCEAIQIFGSSPQSWRFSMPSETQTNSMKEMAPKHGIQSIFFHAVYLINLATNKQENLIKGITSLINYMELAKIVGATAVVFHPGSHRGSGYDTVSKQLITSIQKVVESSPDGPFLAIENTAGMGQHIGADFKELGQIIKAVGSPKVKMCLDTQHSYAAGYNIRTKDGVDSLVQELDREIGSSNIVVVHANDSKKPLGSGVDRHENIGQGHIGIEGFENIMSNSFFKNIPFILEVPGLDGKGPDKHNIDTLKGIRKNIGVT